LSSFDRPHHLYLFDLKNGKKKLAYGESPEDALATLSYRLSSDEMAQVVAERYLKIHQRRIREFLDQLG